MPAPGNLVIVNGTSDPVYKAVTGDLAINSAGVATIGAGKISEEKLTDDLKAKLGVAIAKTANQALSAESTALQEITGLSVAIGASATEQWLVEYLLLLETSVAGDFKIGFTGPAGATMTWSGEASWDNVAIGAEPGAMLPIGTALEIGGRAGLCAVRVTGVVFGGGTAGNLVIKGSLREAIGGAPKVLKGSTVIGRKTAA